MSDLFKNEPEFESRVYEVSDEESTIFSDPKLHRDKVKKGVNIKRIITSSLALLVVAAIVVTVILVIPKPAEEQPLAEVFDPPIFRDLFGEVADRVQRAEGDSDAAYANALAAEYIKEFDKVVLTRDKTVIDYVFAEVEKKTTDDEGKTTTKKVMEWRLKDVDPALTSYSNIDNTVNSYLTQHYTKKISDDKNDGNNYGFDKPTYQVDFYKKGSDDIYVSLIIGGENPSKTGRYATTSKTNEVYYIAGVSEFYHFQKELTDFAEPESIPVVGKAQDYSDSRYTNGQLVMCDKMILSGKNFGDEYVILAQEADNVKTFTSYFVKSPQERPANDENIGNIVALFSYGVTADGCYSYKNDAEELKKFGLDKPDFEVFMKVGSLEIGFKATKQDDGNYAVYYKDNKTIMKVSAGSLAPASYERGDLFNELLFIESITNAESLKVESGLASVDFEIITSHNAETDSENLDAIKVGGKEVEKTNFQSYYQYLVAISAISYEEHDTKGMTPTTVVTLTHKGGKTQTVVKYYQITTARYQVEVNGVKMGLISSSEHTRVMKYAQNVANGNAYNAR